MEDQEIKGFSWTSLFFVTGISFLLFSFVLQLLDEAHLLLQRVSFVALGLGILAFLNTWLGKKMAGNKSTVSSD